MSIKRSFDKWGFEVLGVSLILFALVRLLYRVIYLGVNTDQALLYIMAGCIGFFFMTHKNLISNLQLKPRKKKS